MAETLEQRRVKRPKATPVMLLLIAQARIAKARYWTQGGLAAFADGFSANPCNNLACKWCAQGALQWAGGALKECNEYEWYVATEPMAKAEQYMTDASLGMRPFSLNFYSHTSLNDQGTHEMVMDMFDKAIEFAESLREVPE